MKTTSSVTYTSDSPDRDRAVFDHNVTEFLALWRGRLGYLSMWAALPLLYGSEVLEARANTYSDPPENETERNLGNRPQTVGHRPRSEFLQRLHAYSRGQKTPTLEQSTLAGGTDNCPGQPIPPGNYTAAAPFTDSGTTVGANNTVNTLYCYYYCSTPVNGPDVVYRFKITATGPNPKITIVPNSDNFDPKIYILNPRYSFGCPGNPISNAYDLSWLRTDNSRTVIPDLNYLKGQPSYLFVDSPSGPGGSYTLKVEDVTLAEPKFSAVPSDFDGDFRSDASLFRPSEGKWHLSLSQYGATPAHSWGLSTDTITPADFDGDNVIDMAVYRPIEGRWYMVKSTDSTISSVTFGLNGDMPQPQDFDGDFKADFGLWRPSNGTWYIGMSGSGAMHVQQWGLTGDKPVANDFSGDGKAELAVYRPSEGKWYTFNLVNGTIAAQAWGLAEDKPIPGDYDGDLKSDFAVYRPSNGKWYRINSSSFLAVEGPQFGQAGDVPVPGDYTGDGSFDYALFRPSEGRWYVVFGDNDWWSWEFGANGDIPSASAYIY